MIEEKYILSLDQGTTSSRALIINHQGEVVASAQKEFPQYFPKEGWVEHNPLEIWHSIQNVIAEALIDSEIKAQQIAAIGITNQRETTVIWDKKTGLPIYPAIVWQSRQSAAIAEKLKDQGYEEFFYQKTGLRIDAYFSATKIRFILDQVPDAQQRAEKGELLFGTIDSWLTWNLTGKQVHVTDYTNASRTMLFNIHDLTWDEEILSLLNIPKLLLPKVCSNSEVYGMTSQEHFFGEAVPIAGLAGDQQAALFGQLAFDEGMVKNTYGTGSFIVMNTGKRPKFSKHQLLTTIAYGINGEVHYALEGSIFVAGSAIQWLRDGLQIIQSASESEQLVKQASTENEVYVVPAFVGLGAPYWDQDARGAIFGLTRGTTRADLVKATLQSIAYQVVDIIETMQKDTQLTIPLLKVDGGAANNQYLMQFQADLLNIPVQRAKNLETTALGVALMAGLAVGFWQDLAEIKQLDQLGKQFIPNMQPAERRQMYHGWQKAVQATQMFK